MKRVPQTDTPPGEHIARVLNGTDHYLFITDQEHTAADFVKLANLLVVRIGGFTRDDVWYAAFTLGGGPGADLAPVLAHVLTIRKAVFPPAAVLAFLDLLGRPAEPIGSQDTFPVSRGVERCELLADALMQIRDGQAHWTRPAAN